MNPNKYRLTGVVSGRLTSSKDNLSSHGTQFKMKTRTYTTGISKVYWPKNVKLPEQPSAGCDTILVKKIKAPSRESAAWIAWETFYRDMLVPVLPKHVKRVCVYVNDPTAGVGGLIGRLEPVLVYHRIETKIV